MTAIPHKIFLEQAQLPDSWYNILAHMPERPEPPLQTETTVDLADIFPPAILEQEASVEPYIEIPDEVKKMYRLFRPSPLQRAYMLEKKLGTPAHIYYKYEGNNPSGSHKLNSAIPQAYYNKIAGCRRLTTETGAGQWGTALAIACGIFELECTVYMVKVSAEQKPYRKSIMELYGAQVLTSPSAFTEAGRKILEENPGCSGSLGIAIAEAVEDACARKDSNYALGSVLNHVCLHQSIIGEEALRQFEIAGEYPDMLFACCGGGTNFMGLAAPFFREKTVGGLSTRFVAVEPRACPTLTEGKYVYDYCDNAFLTPKMKMYTLGTGFIPSSIHSGGLRYHGDNAVVSKLYHDGLIEAVAVGQREVFEAAVLFAKYEAILPAPESAHAIKGVIDEALRCKETGEEKVLMFVLSGHGNFDLTAYQHYMAGGMSDSDISKEDLEKGFASI